VRPEQHDEPSPANHVTNRSTGSRKFSLPFCLLLFAIGLQLLNIGLSGICGVKTWTDPLASYTLIPSRERGAPFNTVEWPQPDDITQTDYYFLAWWSPGHYVIPWTLAGVTGIPLHRIEWLIVSICVIGGGIGLWRLYRLLGFQGDVLWLALALPFLTRDRIFGMLDYTGGSIMEFAAWPWLALLALRTSRPSPLQIAALLMAGLIAFFLKSSLLIAFAALLLFQIMMQLPESSINPFHLITVFRDDRVARRNILLYLTTGLVVIGILYPLYMTKGASPPSSHLADYYDFGDDYSLVEKLFYTSASPIIGIFSTAGKLVEVIAARLDASQQLRWGYHILLIVFSTFFLGLIYQVIRCQKYSKEYKRLLLSHALVFVCVFGYLYITESVVSMELRHLIALFLVSIPAIASLSQLPKIRFATTVLIAGIFLSAILGEVLFLQRWNYRMHHTEVVEGLIVERELLKDIRAVEKLDEELGGSSTLFYITPPNPHLELQMKRSRVYPLALAQIGIPKLRHTPYYRWDEPHGGRIKRIIFVTDSERVNGELPASYFTDVDQFNLLMQTPTSFFWIAEHTGSTGKQLRLPAHNVR
jgi:hypothetical protein